jgi:hypothetical protein
MSFNHHTKPCVCVCEREREREILKSARNLSFCLAHYRSPYVAKFTPRRQYIVKYNTRYSNMECWSWAPCGQDYYVAQLPVDDGLGFLVQPMQCRLLTAQSQTKHQYKLVDGERTRDRDNVWMDCTQCDPSSQYQAKSCTLASDAVCLPRLGVFCFLS